MWFQLFIEDIFMITLDLKKHDINRITIIVEIQTEKLEKCVCHDKLVETLVVKCVVCYER